MQAMEECLRAAVEAPRPVPFVRLLAGCTADAGDRSVQVLAVMQRPAVVVLGGLLTDEECDELVAFAQPRMGRWRLFDTMTAQPRSTRPEPAKGCSSNEVNQS